MFGLDYRFEEPTYTEEECRDRDATYAAPLYVKVLLYNRETDQPIVQDVYMGDFPVMTEQRHVHHQRRRARGGEPADSLAGRLFYRGRGSHHGPPALHGQADPRPWRLARVRDESSAT